MAVSLDFELMGLQEGNLLFSGHAHGHHVLLQVGLQLGPVAWRWALAVGFDQSAHVQLLAGCGLVGLQYTTISHNLIN